MKQLVIHPFLFAAFPILSLYANNIDEVQPLVIVKPLVLVLGGTVALLSICNLFLRNWRKSAILVSPFLLMFFFYGHLGIRSLVFGSIVVNQHAVVLPSIFLSVVAGFVLLATSRSDLRILTQFFHVVGLVLVVSSLALVGVYGFSGQTISSEQLLASATQSVSPSSKTSPDIYYIILDGHARSDTLLEFYEYDNTWFIEELENLGFYVADQSTSNYAQTYQSIASSLNFEYINYLIDDIDENSQNRKPFWDLIEHNKVVTLLQESGYLFVNFPSGWSRGDSFSSVDIRIKEKFSIGDFENLLIERTPLAVLLGRDIAHSVHRNKILYALDHMSDVTEIEAPTFSYIHIIAPHAPFIFTKEGEDIPQEVPLYIGVRDIPWKSLEGHTVQKYVAAYRDQLIYIDQRILGAIKNVLANSPDPPVIVLQSDHGPASLLSWDAPTDDALRERMSILNAYYLPGVKSDLLYNSITPVNTFRIVFNKYLGGQYSLLEDKNYFASSRAPYQFRDVTEILRTENK